MEDEGWTFVRRLLAPTATHLFAPTGYMSIPQLPEDVIGNILDVCSFSMRDLVTYVLCQRCAFPCAFSRCSFPGSNHAYSMYSICIMVCQRWRKMNLFKYVVHHAPLLLNLCEKYPLTWTGDFDPVLPICATLSRFIHLRELRLCEMMSASCGLRSRLVDLDFLQCLPDLRFLSVSGFGGLPLNLSRALEKCPHLEVLDMTIIWKGVHLPQDHLPSLHTLWLSSSHVSTDTMESISQLPSLTTLDLTLGTYSRHQLEVLGKSTSLRTLDLSFSKFPTQHLSYLTSLRSLNIRSVSRLRIEALAKLTNLTSLTVGPHSLTDSDLNALHQALPKLVVHREAS